LNSVCRLAEKTHLDGERWFVSRLAAVSLDRIENRRFFAADVGASALEDRDVEIEA